MDKLTPVLNGPGRTFLDEDREVLICMDGAEFDLKPCRKVFVLRTSGDWTPGWVIRVYQSGLSEVLMLEKSKTEGKIRAKCVPDSFLKDRGEPS